MIDLIEYLLSFTLCLYIEKITKLDILLKKVSYTLYLAKDIFYEMKSIFNVQTIIDICNFVC